MVLKPFLFFAPDTYSPGFPFDPWQFFFSVSFAGSFSPLRSLNVGNLQSSILFFNLQCRFYMVSLGNLHPMDLNIFCMLYLCNYHPLELQTHITVCQLIFPDESQKVITWPNRIPDFLIQTSFSPILPLLEQ